MDERYKAVKRTDRMRRKFQEPVTTKASNRTTAIRQSVINSFGEIRSKIDSFEIESNEIINKLARHRRLPNITPKSQPQTDITNLTPTPSKQFEFGIQNLLLQKESNQFQRNEGKLSKIEQFFQRVPVRASLLHQTDVCLKPQNVFYMPFQREAKYNQLKELMIRQQDPFFKNQLQYIIHCLQLRDYIDLLSIDIMARCPDPVPNTVTFQLKEGNIFNIRHQDQYEHLLQQYKILSKYFFQNKKTVVQELRLGELRTDERNSFQNLINAIKVSLKIWQQTSHMQQLSVIHETVSCCIQSEFEQLLVNLVMIATPRATFQAIYACVIQTKNKFVARKIQPADVQLTRELGRYLLGFTKEALFDLITDSVKIIQQIKTSQRQITIKQRLRAIIQRN